MPFSRGEGGYENEALALSSLNVKFPVGYGDQSRYNVLELIILNVGKRVFHSDGGGSVVFILISLLSAIHPTLLQSSIFN